MLWILWRFLLLLAIKLFLLICLSAKTAQNKQKSVHNVQIVCERRSILTRHVIESGYLTSCVCL